jgi:hypothetical protein
MSISLHKKNIPDWLKEGEFYLDEIAKLDDDSIIEMKEIFFLQAPYYENLDEFKKFITVIDFWKIELSSHIENIFKLPINPSEAFSYLMITNKQEYFSQLQNERENIIIIFFQFSTKEEEKNEESVYSKK